MDKLIHTALNSLNNARVRQNVSSQNLPTLKFRVFVMRFAASDQSFSSPMKH